MPRAWCLAACLLAGACAPAPAPPPARPATTPDSTPAPAAPRANLPPAELPAPSPAPTPGPSTGPPLRVGLARTAEAELGGAGAVRVHAPDGRLLAVVPARAGWRLQPGGRGVRLADRAGRVQAEAERVSVEAEDGARVAVGTAAYPGHLEVLPADGKLQVVNTLAMEEYLPAVVAAEIGNRAPAEREAVLAQAIVARTYALRNRGRWAARGYDLEAGVADQVYAGDGAVFPLAREAVQATRGLVLTWDGAPIDAFFSSTCGGHTEDGVAVFAGADRPYLVGRPDVDPAGRAWCAESPRFEWTERWSGAELERALGTTLPALGHRPGPGGTLQDVEVTARSGSGRVAALAIRYRAANVSVEGPNPVRRALAPPAGGWLRSARFSLVVDRDGDRLRGLRAEGGGAGHGVGLCQWGAIGRARAGHGHEAILAAYYPGTTLVQWY